MGNKLSAIPLLIALFLSGCSYFSNKDSIPQQTTPPSAPLTLPAQIPVDQKATPISCDDICSKSGGIKKKFCVKKCEFKKKRADRKALIAECESKKTDLWSRLILNNKDSLGIECRDF